MAFITIEDLVGSIEIIIFPRDYEKYIEYLREEEKIYVTGRATIQEEKEGKLICEKIIFFEEATSANQRRKSGNIQIKQLWLQLKDKEQYDSLKDSMAVEFGKHYGKDEVCIYCKAEKQITKHQGVGINQVLVQEFESKIGKENVKIVEKML